MARCCGLDPCADLEHAVERNAFFTVPHQLHAEDEPHPSHVADERMRLQPAERRLKGRAKALGATDDVYLGIDLLHLERDGGCHRMARVGEPMRKVAELVRLRKHRLVDAIVDQDGRNRLHRCG